MKKPTKSKTVSPAPAPAPSAAAPDATTRPAKPAPKIAPAKVASISEPAVAPAKPAPEAAAPAPAPAISKPPAQAPIKAVAPKRLVTTVTALIDVGFGNALYIRGEGPGLSWDQGLLLECVDDNKWKITLPESAHPIVCKFLLNDREWNLGEDYTVAPGTSITITPVF